MDTLAVQLISSPYRAHRNLSFLSVMPCQSHGNYQRRQAPFDPLFFSFFKFFPFSFFFFFSKEKEKQAII
jgi:hypothetical protein